MSVKKHNRVGYGQGCRCFGCRKANTLSGQQFKAKVWERGFERLKNHGLGGYTLGCRCRQCCEARASYMAKWKAGRNTGQQDKLKYE